MPLDDTRQAEDGLSSHPPSLTSLVCDQQGEGVSLSTDVISSSNGHFIPLNQCPLRFGHCFLNFCWRQIGINKNPALFGTHFTTYIGTIYSLIDLETLFNPHHCFVICFLYLNSIFSICLKSINCLLRENHGCLCFFFSVFKCNIPEFPTTTKTFHKNKLWPPPFC